MSASIQVINPFKNHGSTDFYHRAYRAIAFEYYKRITMKTPRKTGRAAGNWQISVRVQPPGQNNRLLPVDNTFSSAEAAKLSKSKVINFPSITISNALPYILPLEYGLSKTQAPGGMVRVTFSELNNWSARGLK